MRNILQQLRQIHLGMLYLKSYSEAIPRQDVSNLKQKEKPYDKMQWNNLPCNVYRKALTGCRGFFTLYFKYRDKKAHQKMGFLK